MKKKAQMESKPPITKIMYIYLIAQECECPSFSLCTEEIITVIKVSNFRRQQCREQLKWISLNKRHTFI